jgi:hypothetical protein
MPNRAPICQVLTALSFLLIISFLCVATAVDALNALKLKHTRTQASDHQQDAGGVNENSIEEQGPAPLSTGSKDPILKRTIKSLYTYRDIIDKKSKEKIWGKLAFIDFYGWIQRAMGRQLIQTSKSEIFKDSDGKLNFIAFPSNSAKSNYRRDLDELSQSFHSIKKKTDELKIPLLFVVVPPRIFEGYTKRPVGIEDSSFDPSDAIIDQLQQSKIEFVNLQKEILNDKIPIDTVYYKTDHHWTIQTSFWAYTKICDKLINEYGFEFNPHHAIISNFNLVHFQYGFLGSIGNRVGKYYVGVDDFNYLEPKFATDFTVTTQKYDYHTSAISGPFSDAILEKRLLGKENKSGPTNRYAVYLGGDWPQQQITNHHKTNYKALILKDSFALPVSAFLALNFHQVQIIDLRWYKRELSVANLIKNYRPDIVLCIYKPSSLFDRNMSSELVFQIK